MVDRGIENAKVVQFLLRIKDRKNVILLEGNHDKYLKQYGHDEVTRSSVFNKKTKPELDEAGFDKRDIRELARRFHQIAYFTYGQDTYIITHGGISALPDNLLFTATSQLINGVGGYETDIDHVFTKIWKGGTSFKSTGTETCSDFQCMQLQNHITWKGRWSTAGI